MARYRNDKPDIEKIVNDIRHNIGYFQPDPNLRPGDADSSHYVLFGVMPEFGSVAVKPFTRRRQKATREKDALKAVASRGFDALEPLVVAEGGLASYLITRRISDLRHLGELDWRANIASPRLKRSITPTLNKVASVLADLHNSGIVHGDYRVQNAVFDPTGTHVFVDGENAWVDLPPALRTDASNKDVGLFGASALHRGVLSDRSAGYRAGYMKDELLTPYLEAVGGTGLTMKPEERQKTIG